jgi:hypothetical protein
MENYKIMVASASADGANVIFRSGSIRFAARQLKKKYLKCLNLGYISGELASVSTMFNNNILQTAESLPQTTIST